MSSYQFPGGPRSARRRRPGCCGRMGDRRAFFGAAGLGLAMPVLGGLGCKRRPRTRRTSKSTRWKGRRSPATSAPIRKAQAPAMRVRSQPRRSRTRYDPVLAPVEAGPKEITVVAKDASLYIAKDVPHAAWTFDGTVPGRALRVVEGDEINFTLQIDPNATTAHSLDFHSATTTGCELQDDPAGRGVLLELRPLPGRLHVPLRHAARADAHRHRHVRRDDRRSQGWLVPAQELIFVQSDFYLMDGENGIKVPDYTRR